jgi:hypothetical protein
MADTVTSQNIELFFWDTLYSVYDRTNKFGASSGMRIGRETPTKLASATLYQENTAQTCRKIEPVRPQWETGGKSSEI